MNRREIVQWLRNITLREKFVLTPVLLISGQFHNTICYWRSALFGIGFEKSDFQSWWNCATKQKLKIKIVIIKKKKKKDTGVLLKVNNTFNILLQLLTVFTLSSRSLGNCSMIWGIFRRLRFPLLIWYDSFSEMQTKRSGVYISAPNCLICTYSWDTGEEKCARNLLCKWQTKCPTLFHNYHLEYYHNK